LIDGDGNVHVLFMADTNYNSTDAYELDKLASTQNILQRLTGQRDVASITPINTCCYDRQSPALDYDRIGMTGKSVKIDKDIPPLLFQNFPSWAKLKYKNEKGETVDGKFHLPLLASFQVAGAPVPPPTPTTPPAPAPSKMCGNANDASCNSIDEFSGQCMTEIVGCKGLYCNANGHNGDCAWCVYDMALCDAIYGDACHHPRPTCANPLGTTTTTTAAPITPYPCGADAVGGDHNKIGRRCSAVESNSGQCMFDYKANKGTSCNGLYCKANGVDGDCAWCVYDVAQCREVYVDGSCDWPRPTCSAPSVPQYEELTV